MHAPQRRTSSLTPPSWSSSSSSLSWWSQRTYSTTEPQERDICEWGIWDEEFLIWREWGGMWLRNVSNDMFLHIERDIFLIHIPHSYGMRHSTATTAVVHLSYMCVYLCVLYRLCAMTHFGLVENRFRAVLYRFYMLVCVGVNVCHDSWLNLESYRTCSTPRCISSIYLCVYIDCVPWLVTHFGVVENMFRAVVRTLNATLRPSTLMRVITLLTA